MEEVYDVTGHLICKYDSQSGMIESSYKRQKIKTVLPIGGTIVFERNGIVTEVTRQVNIFEVRSYQLVA